MERRRRLSELARVPDVVVRVPNFEIDIGDVDGLAQIARHLYDEYSA